MLHIPHLLESLRDDHSQNSLGILRKTNGISEMLTFQLLRSRTEFSDRPPCGGGHHGEIQDHRTADVVVFVLAGDETYGEMLLQPIYPQTKWENACYEHKLDKFVLQKIVSSRPTHAIILIRWIGEARKYLQLHRPYPCGFCGFCSIRPLYLCRHEIQHGKASFKDTAEIC
jgi:hypothetical protein